MSIKHASETLFQIANGRHSIYALTKTLPPNVTPSHIQSLVQKTFAEAPSAFNSQTTRAVVLFGAEHDRLWDIARTTLRALVKDETAWKATSGKMDMFRNAAGTVLFFDDADTIKAMQQKVPLYKDRFPHWAAQTGGIHQYLLWTALEADGLGASLQHYNPVIDDKVREAWGLPESWKLDAQLVFGSPAQEAVAKPKRAADEVMKVFGA